MKKLKNKIKVAIDSPAAAGAGTVAKSLSKYFNLFYLDTGKIYRYLAYLKIKYEKKFNQSLIKNKIKKLNLKKLNDKVLLSDEIGTLASSLAKKSNIRKIVHNFQLKCAYKFPKNIMAHV